MFFCANKCGHFFAAIVVRTSAKMANLAVIFIAVLYRLRRRQIGAAAMRINGYNAAHQLTYSKEFSWQQKGRAISSVWFHYWVRQ